MIINEECYKDCKESLSKWKSDYVEFMKERGVSVETLPKGQRNGSFEHEINLLQNDIALYEAVTSGHAQLPPLTEFTVFAESMIKQRLAKNLSYGDLVDSFRMTFSEESDEYMLTEIELVGYEMFDYGPAKFGRMLRLAMLIDEAEGKKKADSSLPTQEQIEADLLVWKEEQEVLVSRKVVSSIQSSWFNAYGNSVNDWCSAFTNKLARYQQDLGASNFLKPSFFSKFPEALVMWRLGKKWSYNQLADQVGIDWLNIWDYEKNDYYGTMYAVMLSIAKLVEHGEHEPKDNSFDSDDEVA